MTDEPVKKVKKVVRAVASEKSDKPHPVDLPEFDKRYDAILERSQEIDPLKVWEEISAWLKEEPTSIQDIRNAVRKHAGMAEKAKRLSQAAEIEFGKFEVRCTDRKQIWRVAALSYWEVQKEAKTITKQITEKMIDDWVIEQHGELLMELEDRRIKLDGVRSQLKSLVTQVNNKGHDLRKLLESEVRRPSTSPSWMDGDEKK